MKTTSNPQYRYYYGVILQKISDKTNTDKDSLDIILRGKFSYEYIQIGKILEKRLIPKKELSTQEFNEYLEQVVQWAEGQLDLVIPEPQKVE